METLKPESNIKKKAAPKYSPEVRERAVGMVLEHRGEPGSQWKVIASIAREVQAARAKRCATGCGRPERDRGLRPGSTTQEQERIRELERENRELRQVNEILRKASAYFAQAELDRRPKS